MKKILFVALLSLTTFVHAETIKVFAASSTKLAMTDIVGAYKKAHPTDEILITFSATGKAYAQFSNGFEYDLFMAADTTYPAKIVADGMALGAPKVYANGVIALYSSDAQVVQKGLEGLVDSNVKHISIANPKVAPYGVAALSILEAAKLKTSLESKLVLGDNIAQSVQFVDSGAAEAGLVAFSLIKSTKPATHYVLVDTALYTPLAQAYVLTKHAKGKKLASDFAAFVGSDASKKIFETYGFLAP
ncbi:MAG: molybdate-binding protein [Sulfuricurvum sp. PC08-66]|nr:MAG: molybdate-binding protein [Sulfuricurvum sp. PC08-66]